jgi:hypothetical protein
MKSEKFISRILLWFFSIAIYICTTYASYKFFYAYSYLRNMWLLFGVIGITLFWIWTIWCMYRVYDYFVWLNLRITKTIEELPKNEATETINPEVITQTKKVKKIIAEESVQRKNDKKIQKRYQEILAEYKKTLSDSEFKKFEEDTRYDILLYDALMVNHDKSGTMFAKIEKEKWEFYTSTLKRILDI